MAVAAPVWHNRTSGVGSWSVRVAVTAAAIGLVLTLGPAALFLLSPFGERYHLSFALFFYDLDGSTRIGVWMVRGYLAVLLAAGIEKVARSALTGRRPRWERWGRAFLRTTLVLLIGVAGWFGLETLGIWGYHRFAVPAHLEQYERDAALAAARFPPVPPP